MQVFTGYDDNNATVDGAPELKYQWQRFIAHLADGRGADEFFAALDASTPNAQSTRAPGQN